MTDALAIVASNHQRLRQTEGFSAANAVRSERGRCKPQRFPDWNLDAGQDVQGEPVIGRRMKPTLACLALFVALQDTAWACTLCHTDTAQAVRLAVFGDDFYRHVVVSSLPGLILIALAALVHGRRAK